MEGCTADGVPDSWEVADIDAGMSRLLVSSRKSSWPPDPAEDAAPPPPVSDASGERGGGTSEDVVGQVDQFLKEALEKPRERLAILRMEQDVEKFICDPTQQQLEFQGLPTSYLRLAAHRVAQHYFLQSIAIPDNSLPDGSGSRIVLQKTSFNCRLPAVRLADIPVNLPQEDSNVIVKFAIKQRPQKHSQNVSNMNTHSSKTNYHKSVEERKEEYNRARARIFSTNSNNISSSSGSSSKTAKSENEEVNLPDNNGHHCLFVSARSDEKSAVDERQIHLGRSFSDSSSGGNRYNRNKTEKEPTVGGQRAINRVAIFRDHEVDRKDPDYDRSYERYMQRFDPGFGFNGGAYTMQPLYSPAVNYNTEFPQLGSGQRVQIPIEHPPRPISQHMRGHWSSASAPTALNYGPPEGMLEPFSPSLVGAQSTSSVYMHSSQYSVPPCPPMPFVHPHEHIQSFAQTHQRQPEASFGLARPR